MKKTRLLNTYVNNITMDEAVDFCCKRYGNVTQPM